MVAYQKFSPGLDEFEARKQEYKDLFQDVVGGIEDLCFLPPVPGQKLLAKNGLSRSILPELNKAVVEKKAILNAAERLIFVPLWYDDTIIGVSALRYTDRSDNPDHRLLACLSTMSSLFVRNLSLDISRKLDPETGLVPELAFLEKLKSLVEFHSRESDCKNGHNAAVPDGVPATFTVGLFRNLPKELYPVNLWSNRWLDVKEFARLVAGKIPAEVTGALLRGGEVGIIVPGDAGIDCELLADDLSRGVDDLHGAVINFPFDFSELKAAGRDGAAGSGDFYISMMFEKLWTILNSTVITSHKRVWSWHDLVHLGVAPETALVFSDDFLREIDAMDRFACFSVRFRPERFRSSLHELCAKLEKVSGQLFPENSAVRWIYGSTMLVVVPGAGRRRAEELVRKLMSEVEKGIGEGLNVGVSTYPEYGFSRREALYNSMKALVHSGLVSHHGWVFVDSVTLNLSGDNYFNQGKLELARREYEKGVKIDGKNSSLLNSLGVCYGELGIPGKAKEIFEEVLKLKPDDFMASFNLGCLLMRQDKFAEAENMLKKAIETNPASAEAHFYLGRIRFQSGEYVDAVFHLEKAVKGYGAWKPARRLLAESYEKLGNDRKAMEHYKHVLRTNPEDAISLHALGRLYGKEDRNLEVAISLCEKAVAFDESNKDYRLTLAKFLYRAGDFRGALGHLEAISGNDGYNKETRDLKEEIEKSISRTERLSGEVGPKQT